MQNAGEIVSAFVKEFDTAAPDIERIAGYFTDDAVYHNIPMAPIRGKDAIRAAIGPMLAAMKPAGWEVTHQVAAGNVVMNERIDRFEMNSRTIAVPVAGVFEVRDGKIAAWRDYFDLKGFQDQMQA